jgi:hypothetical protein
MREKIVLICPTPQARTHAADWHDGQFAHAAYAGIAANVILLRIPALSAA